MDDGGALILRLVIGLIFGGITSAMANNKGRSAVGWFFGGFFLGLIAIIIVACLSNVREVEAASIRDQEEKRRLREQLRQEQLKSESYRQYTMDRLDSHDRALGIDTRETQIALPVSEPVRRPVFNLPGTSIEASPPPKMDMETSEVGSEWYYSNNGEERLGPFTIYEMKQLAASREINEVTLVWSEKLNDWTPAGQVPELHQSTI